MNSNQLTSSCTLPVGFEKRSALKVVLHKDGVDVALSGFCKPDVHERHPPSWASAARDSEDTL